MARDVLLDEHLQEADSELAKLVHSLCLLSPVIREEFPHRINIDDVRVNKYGESVKALDVWTNELLIYKMRETGLVNTIYSEETDEPLVLNPDAPFYVAIDPLDGSSNIKTNNLFGTLVGIYRKPLPCKGRDLKCAFFKLYGPITTLMYSAGRGVHEFVKNRKGEHVGKFTLLREKLTLPEPGSVYGIGALKPDWIGGLREFEDYLVNEKRLKLRYGGALVGDANQTLHYGGFFAYPATKKDQSGKYRLYYESNTMAFLFEQAGGASSDGRQSILDRVGDSPDARTPFYAGNKDLVKKLSEFVKH